MTPSKKVRSEHGKSAEDGNMEFSIAMLKHASCPFIWALQIQYTYGIILQLPATACLPNLPSYHFFVPSAVTPRLTATKTKAQKLVRLTRSPAGADTMAKER